MWLVDNEYKREKEGLYILHMFVCKRDYDEEKAKSGDEVTNEAIFEKEEYKKV